MVIREMVMEDISFFNEVRTESYQFLHDKKNYTLEENILWFKKLKNPFFIVEKEGEKIGYFRTSNWDSDSAYDRDWETDNFLS